MSFSIIILIVYAVMAFYYLYKKELLQSSKTKIVAATAILLAFVIRELNMSHESQDYITFLSDWVDYFRTHGGFLGLKDDVGNYNIPYLAFLAAISYVDRIDSLTFIKLLSILFDVFLAIGATQLVSLVKNDNKSQLISFFSVLYLPTVVINGSFWAQCDSIYVALSILSLYFALSYKPWLSIIFIAAAFGFKLQTIFIMPIFALLWACGYFKWYHFIAFPVTYFVMMLPAVFAGKPLLDSMLVYVSQVDTAGEKYSGNGPTLLLIVQSAPTLLYFLNTEEIVPIVCKAATISALVIVVIILLIQFLRRDQMDKKQIIITATLFSLVIPFLLPHMHERYFFLADILTLVLSCIDFKYLPTCILTEGASLWCYWSLYNYVADSYRGCYGSFAIFFAIVILLVIYIIQIIKSKNPVPA